MKTEAIEIDDAPAMWRISSRRRAGDDGRQSQDKNSISGYIRSDPNPPRR
jgi:hypothetical protein